jgi:hypothetical protein
MAVKIVVAIPNYRESVPGRFLDCMMQLSVRLARQFGPGEIEYIRVGFMYIDVARNIVWQRTKQSQADSLLFIDDDMTFTPKTFDVLWSTPGDIVSALYFVRRLPPTEPCMYRKGLNGLHQPITDYPPDAALEVDAVGLGFALIRKPVLDAFVDPFDKYPKKGEDIVLCEKARAAGFKVMVNTAAKAGHLMNIPVEINEENAGEALPGLYGTPKPKSRS